MAKSPRAALTRIATTVQVKNYPSSGASAGFYLDGRLSSRREQKAADITLDREDRGFFYSVYASLAGSQSPESARSRNRKALDKIMSDVKQPGRNIDAEINELAECAVHVAGRITLQQHDVNQPYFAGIVVRDSELAAVTMGSGCAYLYRGDILYPLTSDDYPLEAIDMNGKPVNGLDVYCAGVAGTVRYSNIAQLQLDDCIIVCNKEVMEALGQREVLRLLYEADDQADAAGLIMAEASSKLPGIPMQFMIGFVESIVSADRTGRFGFGRSQPDVLTGRHTAPFTPIGNSKKSSKTAPLASSAATAGLGQPIKAGSATASGPKQTITEVTVDYEDDLPDVYDDEYEDVYDDSFAQTSRGRKIAFYLIIAAVCIGSLFAIYNMLFGGDDEDPQTTSTTTISDTSDPEETGNTETNETEPAASDPTDETEDITTDETDPDETEETSETDPEETEDTTQETTTEATTTAETTTAETTTEATTAETTTAPTGDVNLPVEHTVTEDDTVYGIIIRYYGTYTDEYVALIANANDLENPDVVLPGDVLTIPALP